MTDPAYAAFVARLTAPQPEGHASGVPVDEAGKARLETERRRGQPVVDWQAVAQREARRRRLWRRRRQG